MDLSGTQIQQKKLENIEEAKTKKEVLTTLASIFDLLCMITPVTLKMKLHLQELWEKEKERDERLSSEEITTQKGFMADLNGIFPIHLPRFAGIGSTELLCFCHLSSKAYATAIYLLTIKNNKITVILVFSKVINAPKKKLTTPKLELMSVLIGTRSLSFVAKVMRLENAEKILWTDFQCILQWIKNRENTSVFVRNLITEIINGTDVAFWYINTKQNPAAIPTQGLSTKKLKNNKLCCYGPEWLWQDPNEWPEWNTTVVEANSESFSEERGKKHMIFWGFRDSTWRK